MNGTRRKDSLKQTKELSEIVSKALASANGDTNVLVSSLEPAAERIGQILDVYQASANMGQGLTKYSAKGFSGTKNLPTVVSRRIGNGPKKIVPGGMYLVIESKIHQGEPGIPLMLLDTTDMSTDDKDGQPHGSIPLEPSSVVICMGHYYGNQMIVVLAKGRIGLISRLYLKEYDEG